MIITNNKNLPLPFLKAVKNDPYDSAGADYSVTTLLKPARIVTLERRHKDELTQDASKMLASLQGQIIHGILERAALGDGFIVEERFGISIGDVSVSGQIDLYEYSTKHLQDWKYVKAANVKDGKPSEDYVKQVNICALLVGLFGVQVEQISVAYLFRDWDRWRALRDPSYPQQEILILAAPLWTQEEQLAFLEGRITAMESAKGVLPECTPEERWSRGGEWAVKKGENVRAINGGLHRTKEDADFHASMLGEPHWVEERPGTDLRCEEYCQAAPFCEYAKKKKAEKEKLGE